MADAPPFKVIIAGGGIGGLSMALILEKANIDYVLLEKRDIAPEFGASIAMLPSSFRILEQLGMAESLQKTIIPLQYRSHWADGRQFARTNEFELLLAATKRPIAFMERRLMLEIFYDGIKDKSKVRSRCGVESYVEDEKGVTVTTTTGETVRGSMLVGVDGVHSRVRSCLADSIESKDPEAAHNLRHGFEARFSTLFCTSRNERPDDPSKPLFADGTVVNTYYPEVGGVISTSVAGLTFWFMYVPLDKPVTSPNTPRYTDADLEAVMKKYGHLPVGDNMCTYQDLWNCRVKGFMFCTEEGIISAPWHSPGGRVTMVGDAVHKMSPNLGFGGNMGVHGAASLVNELVKVLGSTKLPTAEELRGVCERYEAKQRVRAQYAVTLSKWAIRFDSSYTWYLRWARRWVYALIPDSYKVGIFLDFEKTAPKLDFLPETIDGAWEEVAGQKDRD